MGENRLITGQLLISGVAVSQSDMNCKCYYSSGLLERCVTKSLFVVEGIFRDRVVEFGWIHAGMVGIVLAFLVYLLLLPSKRVTFVDKVNNGRSLPK